MLIAGGALRTMRLVNKATSNYHVDALHAVQLVQSSFRQRNTRTHHAASLITTARLHAIDAASGHDF